MVTSNMFIEEFKIWFEQNRDKFISKPYIYKNRIKNKINKHLELRFENIIQEIYIHVNKQEICVWVDLEKIIELGRNDILADFMVDIKQNDERKYYNGFLLEPHAYYDTLKEVYYEEFNYFLIWINSAIKEENFLAVAWNGGITSARIINPEAQPEEFESYKDSSGKTGLPLSTNEVLLSEFVNLKNEMIISGSKRKNWLTILLSLSLKE